MNELKRTYLRVREAINNTHLENKEHLEELKSMVKLLNTDVIIYKEKEGDVIQDLCDVLINTPYQYEISMDFYGKVRDSLESTLSDWGYVLVASFADNKAYLRATRLEKHND